MELAYQSALKLHQSGKLTEAKALYEQILLSQPENFNVLHLLAALAAQAGDPASALALADKAIGLRPDFVQAHVTRGNALATQARIDDALASYDAAIRFKPDHADAHFRKAQVLLGLGRKPAALDALARTIAAKPQHIEALNQQGVLLLELGRPADAAQSLAQAVALAPQVPELHFRLGAALFQQGRYDAAAQSFKNAIGMRVTFVEAWTNLALSLQQAGQSEQALAVLRQADAVIPNSADVQFNLGVALAKLGGATEALASFDRAIALNPAHAQAWCDRGPVLAALGRPDEAIESGRKAITLRPDMAVAYCNLGQTLLAQRRYDEAVGQFDTALTLQPNFSAALYNRGLARLKLHHDALAASDFEAAIVLDPGFADAHASLGIAFAHQQQFEPAIRKYDEALALNPSVHDYQWNRAIVLLRASRLREGFMAYESRWEGAALSGKRRTFPQPLWLGETPIEGKTLFLHCEQGLGDTIQFGRYATLAAQQGAKVILGVQPPLRKLFEGFEGAAQVISDGDDLPPFDLHTPLLSMPLAMGTTLETIPGGGPYLRADPAKVEAWRRRLGETSRPRVGLVWSGNIKHGDDNIRSLPLPEVLPRLPAGIDYVSLQKEFRPEDLDLLRADGRIATYGEDLKDFTDTAALCACMDLVVSVDTSVAHLAGALGKPTWIILSSIADWRWLAGRPDSPWYPSVRLFRQREYGRWDAPLAEAAAGLAALAGMPAPTASGT